LIKDEMMASKRNISQKKPQFGQRRSHSLQATKRQFKLNMQWTNVYVPELGRTVRIR
jgi:ribosomal protein L28